MQYAVTEPRDSVGGCLRSELGLCSSGDTVIVNIPGADTIHLQSSITLAASITIDGINKSTGRRIVVKADTSDSNYHNDFIISGCTVHLKSMEIRDGRVWNGVGGNIFISGSNTVVFLDSCIVANGRSLASYLLGDPQIRAGGGGLYIASGNLTVSNCTFRENAAIFLSNFVTSAISLGGGICNDSGTILLINSTICKNGSNASGYATRFSTVSIAYGGGVANLQGRMTIVNCSFSENICNSYASAYWAYSYCYGSGVYNGSGTIVIANSTIAHDSSYASATSIAPTAHTYGGVYCESQTSYIVNSIVNGNIGSDSSSGYSDSIAHRKICLNVATGSLSDNGGPTFTMPIYFGSPAIGAGLPIGSFVLDSAVSALITANIGLAYFSSSAWHSVENDSVIIPDASVTRITTDQRGVMRADTPCAGAFEYTPGQSVKNIQSNKQPLYFSIRTVQKKLQIISNEPVRITFFDLSGRTISSSPITTPSGTHYIQTVNFPKRQLICRIEGKDGIAYRKIAVGL
jgi:hypothetical protein